MIRITAAIMMSFFMSANCNAATWVKLFENNTSKITLDKQSILQKDNLKRAWVKIEYKVPQQNLESPDKEYNTSKVLWFFDCGSQKSATSQVFQYLDDQLVYSVAIDSKQAEFIEPVPETDVDIAMRYICFSDRTPETGSDIKANSQVSKANSEATKSQDANVKKDLPIAAGNSKPDSQTPKTDEEIKPQVKQPNFKSDSSKVHWSYEGKEGPDIWSKLSPDYFLCEFGRNQSPINIGSTVHASLSPLRALQKFPAKEIINNGHAIQVNFKEGNMLVLDNDPYQMKEVQFHTPSENTVNGISYPMEAEFIHSDSKGNITIVSVMFKEGKANSALSNLLVQIPAADNGPAQVKARVVLSDLFPQEKTYYRLSGSLTSPPCNEGVRWVLMKSAMTASKEQIELLSKSVRGHNNRPVQALNGRLIVE